MSDADRRILVVDDDREVRSMLGSVLRHRGLSVDEASGGQEAIDFLHQNRYSVVLLDLLMPHPDGFAVLGALDVARSTSVVLVLTGADRSVVDRLDSRLIHGIVRKPFDAEELAGLVVACANIRSRGSFGMMAVAVMGARIAELLTRLS